MYVRSTIQTAALQLVGWRKSTHELWDQVPTALKSPSTEYYVNDIPGITVNLLDYTTPEMNVSDYLSNVHSSEILSLVDNFLAKQKDLLNSKELLQHNTLLQGYNELDMTITRSGRFVGYAITPRESNTITSKILSVGFLSSEAQSFTLYLFDTSQKTAIETQAITITTADSVEWTDLNWDISFDREAGSAGQKYLIGYFEDDLTGDMYEENWTGSQAHVAQRIFGHYMGVSPCRFSSSALDGTNRPVLEYLQGALNCKTPGFNLRFNTKCDITKVLEDNITMFAEALQYKIAIRILNDALSYIELNNVTNAGVLRAKWNELLTEYRGRLHGGITAAGIPVKGLIDHLAIDFSTLDGVCLKEKRGQIQRVRW